MSTFQYIQFACLRTVINTSLYFRRSSWLSPATQPDETRVFNDRHDLFPGRIFIPTNGKNASEQEQSGKALLPLVIMVHGGGFILNNPSSDDPLARQLADEAGCMVVSVDYRKSPQTRFPGALEDVVTQALAILDHAGELNADLEKVVLLGSSAGGNLVLSAVQDERLRGNVKGVIGLYPPTDWRIGYEEKMASRPDPSVPDFLGASINTIKQLYLDPNSNIDMADPSLSPGCFTSRADLPPNVLLVGVEHDMLCREAENMADRLASDEGAEKVGNEFGWKAGGVQWRLVKGMKHGFDHFPEKDGEREKVRSAAKEATWRLFGEWVRGVRGCK